MVKQHFTRFFVDNQWFALYSGDHTTTRIARLETHFEDWCGELPNSFGFYLVEFFVPKYWKDDPI